MNVQQEDDPLIGSKIGPCRVELRLAAGGMGVVYRARHLHTNQDVAVKILAPSLAADQEYVTRFFREAGAAGQIDHSNVVRVIDVGRHEDKYYLVMEFVEGETLDKILDNERRLPLNRATKLVREIAAGLAAAHRAGIIHRDVKPGNVIVSPDGKPHLTDFGLARHTETRKGLTIEGTFLGTPEYASPEQVEGRRLDHRTDLYSLGVTYYQLLSGTLPFLGESPMEIAIKRTKEEPRPLENALSGADPRACALVKRLLQTEVGRRPQSATEVIRELDAILTGQSSANLQKPSTIRAGVGSLAAVPRKRRAQALLHWGLVVVAIALAFLSGALATGGPKPLESWTGSAPGRAARLALCGAALVVAAGAALVQVKDKIPPGRWAAVALLLLGALASSLAAGLLIDHGQATSASQVIQALIEAVRRPVNLVATACLLLFSASVISFEHEPGSYRVAVSRVMVFASFVLFFSFGSVRAGLLAPFREFLTQPELSIPLATATLLVCVFGLLLLTGYDFEARSRVLGLALCLVSAVGLYSVAVLVSQPAEPDMPGKPWTALLREPLSGLGESFRRSGTPLAVAIALALIGRSIVASVLRRQDRVRRRF